MRLATIRCYNRMMTHRQVTSWDIAAAAGVSQATVSRALRNSPLVREETRERVRRAAQELNYSVNRYAAGLRTHQSRTLALMLFPEAGDDSQINPFFLSMLGNITQAAARHDYDVLVTMQQLNSDWPEKYLMSQRADGLILLGYGDYQTYCSQLASLDAADLNYIIWGANAHDHVSHSVGCDNFQGGYEATRHLLATGRKHIAFMGNMAGQSPELDQRFKGFQAAHEDAGIKVNPAICIATDSENNAAELATDKLIAGEHAIDGLFAATDVIAIAAMHRLQSLGLNIPNAIGVVGFDDLPLALHVSPTLTTIRQDVRQAGNLLVSNLVKMIAGEAVSSALLKPTLVVRESSGK